MPGCGAQEETQLHMFQCQSLASRNAQRQAFKLLEKYYNEHKISRQISVPFIRLCRQACDQMDGAQTIAARPSVATAIKSQTRLGVDFLLRGILTKDWLPAMIEMSRDHPEQRLAHLQVGLWKVLFGSVWDNRNTILHGKSSLTDKYERRKLLDELAEWRQNSARRLGANQQYLIDYTMDEARGWTTPCLREHINLIVRATQNHTARLLDISQPRITDFFPSTKERGQI